MTLLFHNCAGDGDVNFSSDSQAKIEESLTSNAGVGEGYFGKPREGDYVRAFPSFQCNQTNDDQGLLAVDADSADINEDNCETKDITFSFNDSVLAFSLYNRDYLGVGTAIYKHADVNDGSLPVTEAWCRYTTESSGIDIALTVDHQVSQSKAKVYLASQQLGGWQAREVNPFSVTRNQTGQTISYSSNSMILRVTKPQAPQLFGNGNLEIMVDDVRYNYAVICRVANRAPIEEMNTGLSSMYAIDQLTTDSQESLCANGAAVACDNFEDRLIRDPNDLNRVKFKNAGFQMSFPSTQFGVGTAERYQGTKSFEFVYPAGGSTSGGGILSLPLGRDMTTVYTRYYVKFSSNFVWSSTESDLFHVWAGQGSVNFIVDGAGRINHFTDTDGPSGAISSNYSLPLNQWLCVEYGVKFNSSATASDGFIEMWVNGNKIIDRQNIIQYAGDNLRTNEVSINSDWYCANGAGIPQSGQCDTSVPANNHPAQSVWYDNLVVAGQRVGCY